MILRSLLIVATPQYKVQGSEDASDALDCRSLFSKRATNYRALWRKMTYEDKASLKIRHPRGLRQPVQCGWGECLKISGV